MAETTATTVTIPRPAELDSPLAAQALEALATEREAREHARREQEAREEAERRARRREQARATTERLARVLDIPTVAGDAYPVVVDGLRFRVAEHVSDDRAPLVLEHPCPACGHEVYRHRVYGMADVGAFLKHLAHLYDPRHYPDGPCPKGAYEREEEREAAEYEARVRAAAERAGREDDGPAAVARERAEREAPEARLLAAIRDLIRQEREEA